MANQADKDKCEALVREKQREEYELREVQKEIRRKAGK